MRSADLPRAVRPYYGLARVGEMAAPLVSAVPRERLVLVFPAAAAAPAFRMGGFGIGALTGTDSDALSGAARAGPHAMRFQGGGASHEGRICGTNLCSRVTNLWFFVSEKP